MQTQRGQGALEYLILIGAAVFMAFIVMSVMLGSGPRMRCQNATNTWYSICSAKMVKGLCEATDIDHDGIVDCKWDDTAQQCTLITGDPKAGNPPACRH